MTTWSTPLTWPSAVVSVAQLNQQLRDNMLYLYEHRLAGYAVTMVDAVSTVAETDILSFTVPANEWQDGEVIELVAWIAHKNNKGTTGTLTPKLYVGGVSAARLNVAQANTSLEYMRRHVFSFQRGGTTVYAPKDWNNGGNVQTLYSYLAGDRWGDDLTNTAPLGTEFQSWTPTFTGNIVIKVTVTPSASDATFYVKPKAACAWRFSKG